MTDHSSPESRLSRQLTTSGEADRPRPEARRRAKRPIAVDDDGFLVAQSDFTEAVGPSHWEREA